MITVRLGAYKKLYSRLETFENIDELEEYAKSIHGSSEYHLWFLEGLLYYTKLLYKIKKDEESKSKNNILDIMLNDYNIGHMYNLENEDMLEITTMCIKAEIEDSSLVNLIYNSKLEYIHKEAIIGFIESGLDPIGYYSKEDLIDYKNENKNKFITTALRIQNFIMNSFIVFIIVSTMSGLSLPYMQKIASYITNKFDTSTSEALSDTPKLSANVLQAIEDRAKANSLTESDRQNLNNTYAMTQLLRKFHTEDTLAIVKSRNTDVINKLADLYKVDSEVIIESAEIIREENNESIKNIFESKPVGK